jgi:poly(3-hydroxybutyrate) depolymerase
MEDVIAGMRFLAAAAFPLFLITTNTSAAESGRLAIPAESPKETAAPGLIKFRRTGLLYVPMNYQPNKPLPFLVLLHRAAGNCAEWFYPSPAGSHPSLE